MRVAIRFSAHDTSLGIANYYANLLTAVTATPAAGIQPVIVTGTRDRLPSSWPAVEVIGTRLLDARTLPWLARGLLKRVSGADLLLERSLVQANIELVSHEAPARLTTLPRIAWIPDLQHFRLPAFFELAERRARDRHFADACRRAVLVIASSEDARRDLEELVPHARGKVRVLRFVACAGLDDAAAPATSESAPYLFLPNQFWAHKNHGVVIDALALLKRRDRRVRVICTGQTHDYRDPGYFDRLIKRAAEAGLDDLLSVRGVVPYGEVVQLMRTAVAVLNPSLFEGWSTSVEEAKSSGKAILLSDIPVHREQSPERGRYFKPDDPEALADAMWSVWTAFDPAVEKAQFAIARERLPERVRAFALEYAAIVREARSQVPAR